MAIGTLLRKALSTQDERGRTTSDRFRLAVRRTVRNMIIDVTGPILDAGGADGLLFDPRVSPLARAATVLDLDTEALGQGRRAYGSAGKFVCGDITNMPFCDGVFDVAVCVGTFYNFPSADIVAKGIAEMARVTSPSGSVFVEFRNADNPIVRQAYKHAGTYDPTLDGLPLNAYTTADIRAMLEKIHLEVRRIQYIGIPLKHGALGFVVEAVHRNQQEL